MTPGELVRSNAALVIGHCGHELMVHGWLESARPTVFALTDGTGRGQPSRVASSRSAIVNAGATCGRPFAPLSDRAAYGAMLAGDADVFVRLCDELAGALVERSCEVVVADALEGYNPTHDVCRFVADAAVELAERATGRPIASFSVRLDRRGIEPATKADDEVFTLDDAALDRKIAAARTYAELASTVEDVLGGNGRESVRREGLRRLPAVVDPESIHGPTPYYERYGEALVAAGRYREVLRYRAHVRPIFDALRRHAGGHRVWPVFAS